MRQRTATTTRALGATTTPRPSTTKPRPTTTRPGHHYQAPTVHYQAPTDHYQGPAHHYQGPAHHDQAPADHDDATADHDHVKANYDHIAATYDHYSSHYDHASPHYYGPAGHHYYAQAHHDQVSAYHDQASSHHDYASPHYGPADHGRAYDGTDDDHYRQPYDHQSRTDDHHTSGAHNPDHGRYHRMKTAWVLRGGASFAASQVGMARALLEAGHYPDLLYGTSAGALNAAWLAADPTLPGVSRLAELWAAIRKRNVFPFRPWVALAGITGFSDHTVSPTPLARWLRAVCVLRQLDDGVLPLTVVTTDIENGEEVLLGTGPAVPALLASSAIPGIFPPVRIGDRWLMDGSIASDTPIGPAVEAGATRVWVLPSVPTGRAARPRSAMDALLGSSSILLSRQHANVVGTWASRCQLYVLPAVHLAGTSAFNFSRSNELIAAAYKRTTDWLGEPQPVVAPEHQ